VARSQPTWPPTGSSRSCAASCSPGRSPSALPGWTASAAASWPATATRGIDALDGYLARYLPALAQAALVPVLLLAFVWPVDRVSVATMAVTIPLIPVFMILIGLSAQAATRRQWLTLSLLGAHFLDVLQGLPTLKIFGRERAQLATIRAVTDRYRRATMGTLRVAFLSALALEMLATLSVALVAVGIGLRLVSGGMRFESGLMVLLLAPEVYLPLRQVGSHFHASTEGMEAAARVFEVLEQPLPAAGTAAAPDPAGARSVSRRSRSPTRAGRVLSWTA